MLDALRLIDQEINKHLCIVANLKHRQNSLLPISRLPNEILIAIFLQVTRNRRKTTHKVSLKLLHVCKRWQEVALGYNLLWSHWRTMPSESLPLFASRSGMAPLMLEISCSNPPSDPFVASWTKVMGNQAVRDRVESIDLEVDLHTVESLLAHLGTINNPTY